MLSFVYLIMFVAAFTAGGAVGVAIDEDSGVIVLGCALLALLAAILLRVYVLPG